MCVNVSYFGSNTLSPPVDQMRPSGAMRMVCLRKSSWNSTIFWVVGSQRASFLEPASVIQTEPSGAGTAEWISAGPMLGTGNSFISPVCGLSRITLLACPYSGVQRKPSLSPFEVHVKRLGPGIS